MILIVDNNNLHIKINNKKKCNSNHMKNQKAAIEIDLIHYSKKPRKLP